MPDTNVQPDSWNESAMTNADEELRRRRERGRLSQARFRKKQAQASREANEENERMRTAISEIVRATQCSDRSKLLNAIRAAASVAGVDPSDLGKGNNGKCAETVGRHLEIDEGNVEIESPTQTRSTDCSKTSSKGGGERQSPMNQMFDVALRPSLTDIASPSSGRLSPRLDYGIWVDASRAAPVSKPPHDIIPFLGSGRYTFAGCLYWAGVDYTISLCRLVTSPYAPSPWFDGRGKSRPSPQEAEKRVWTMLRHTPPLRNVRLAQALAEAQREYLDTGYIRGDSPACDSEIGILLRREIEADYVARGADLGAWMTIRDVEKYVRQQLGNEAFSRLERTIAVDGSTNHLWAMDDGLDPGSDARAVVRLLIKNLAENYICFGDGPRWRADSISTLFSRGMEM